MKEIIKVQCPCGQENQLVETGDGLRYDITRHGNGELCKGKCFNCHAPLKGLASEPETASAPEPKPTIENAAETAKETVEQPQGKKKKK